MQRVGGGSLVDWKWPFQVLKGFSVEDALLILVDTPEDWRFWLESPFCSTWMFLKILKPELCCAGAVL